MFIQPVANLNKNCGYFLRPWPFVLSGLGHHFFHGTCWNDCIHSFPPSKLPPFPPARWVFEIWNIELQIQLWHWRNTLEHLGPVVFESNGEKFKDWQNLGDYFMWLFCVYNCIYIYIIWLVVSNVFFHPGSLGKITNLTNMFEMGWNHHLEMDEDLFFQLQGGPLPAS